MMNRAPRSPMLVRFVALMGIFISFAERSLSDDDRQASQLASLSKVSQEIKELEGEFSDSTIARLGEIIRKTSRRSVYQVEERWSVHRDAKTAMIRIPGYAEYFKRRLSEIKKDLRGQGGNVAYNRERVHCFEVMKLLPDPEIVRVLGEFLSDREDVPPPPKEFQDYSAYPANDKFAARTLGTLIQDSPVQAEPDRYSDADIETWKLWYDQVKAGTRGFKLKGDPTVHYLTKIQEKSDATSNSPTALPEPEIVARKAEPVVTTVPPKRPFPLIGTLIASGFLLLSIGWLIVSKRKARVGKT